MTPLLLANGLTTIQIVLISVGAAIGVLSLVWGVFRKFTRMSWGGWQVLVIFALTYLLKFIPTGKSPTLTFCLTAGGFLGVIALILGAGALVRRLLESHRLPVGIRVCDRILGGLTALVDWVAFAGAFGGFALVCCESFGVGAVSAVTSNGIWQKVLGGHIADLILVAFLVYAVKGGYKLGLIKSLFALFGITLTLGSFVGALLLTIKWKFLHGLAGKIGGLFHLNSITAGLLGYFIVIFIVFLVFFIVSMLLCALLNLLLKRANRHPILTAVDGTILAIVFYLLAVVFVCAVHYGVYALGSTDIAGGNETLSGILNGLSAVKSMGDALASSPLSTLFYSLNPLRNLF